MHSFRSWLYQWLKQMTAHSSGPLSGVRRARACSTQAQVEASDVERVCVRCALTRPPAVLTRPLAASACLATPRNTRPTSLPRHNHSRVPGVPGSDALGPGLHDLHAALCHGRGSGTRWRCAAHCGAGGAGHHAGVCVCVCLGGCGWVRLLGCTLWSRRCRPSCRCVCVCVFGGHVGGCVCWGAVGCCVAAVWVLWGAVRGCHRVCAPPRASADLLPCPPTPTAVPWRSVLPTATARASTSRT
jgi:hypothetical protein